MPQLGTLLEAMIIPSIILLIFSATLADMTDMITNYDRVAKPFAWA
jgi:hypothetical protein